MDADRFDAVTARLATPLSRRRGAGLLGLFGLGCLTAVEDAAAKKRKKKKKKKTGSGGGSGGGGGCAAGSKPCNGACIPNTQCCTNGDCDRCAREVCQAGSCGCPAGMTRGGHGICGTQPACIPAGQFAGNAAQCCSGAGSPGPVQGLVVCQPGHDRCLSDNDCAEDTGCLGYLCAGPYAQAVGSGCRGLRACASRTECASAYCRNGACAACTSDAECGSAGSNACGCYKGTCYNRARDNSTDDCAKCPAGTVVCETPFPRPGGYCLRRCGA